MPAKAEIVAHRGFSFVAPENTKASFMLAWKVGTPAAECDVHLTKDKRIMVMHDKSAKRTAGVDVNMPQTDSKTLRKLDVGSWKDPNHYKGEKIPYLEEIIKTIPKGRKLFIEVKSGKEIMPYLENVIKKSGKRDRLTIIGFDLEAVAAAKKLMPDIPVYWLVYSGKKEKTEQWIPYSQDLIVQAKENSLDGLDLHYGALDAMFVQQVHNAGLKLYVWTVDDAKDVKLMRKFGVDGITTNRPNLFLK
jgi:glycerophosphoryl diester phosphodiesterase